MPVAVTTKDFEEKVMKAEGLVMVDFWAAWCPPCRALGPILEQVEKDSKDKVTVAKVDVDANQELSQKYGIQGLPTVKLFKDGEEVETWVGLMPKQQYLEMIAKHS